jgi:cobaltochelatase CobS
MTSVSKISCQICGAQMHAVENHLRQDHPDWTIDRYKVEYPHAPLLSKAAEERLAQKRQAEAMSSAPTSTGVAASVATPSIEDRELKPLNELFGLGSAPAAFSASKKPIMITVLKSHEHQQYVPDKDNSYVYNIDVLKNALLAVQMNINLYVWGHMGTGKSTLIEQVYAHLNRALIRVQHTLNTEEAHILGQWIVRNGDTVYEPGWLPLAMRNGWGYLADEYDFATPHVLSVYQPILEGKALIIKDASPEWRVVKPHKDFRFAATGNTNGVGDETGIYQGTQIQNAANYERFGIVMKIDFMERALEESILKSRAKLADRDAASMIEFATKIRENKEISMPISPRSLITASQLGVLKSNFRSGLELAYINRLPAIEREAASSVAQRIFK